MHFTMPSFSSHSAAADRSASTASAQSNGSSKGKKMSAVTEYWTVGPALHGFGALVPTAQKSASTKAKKEPISSTTGFWTSA